MLKSKKRSNKKKFVALFLALFTVFAFATTAQAISQNFSFDLRNFETSGQNRREWAKGSVRVIASGTTYDPWDGNERYKVNMKGGLVTNSTDFFTADGVQRTKYLTHSAAGSKYPVVSLGRSISGSGTLVSGSGNLYQ